MGESRDKEDLQRERERALKSPVVQFMGKRRRRLNGLSLRARALFLAFSLSYFLFLILCPSLSHFLLQNGKDKGKCEREERNGTPLFLLILFGRMCFTSRRLVSNIFDVDRKMLMYKKRR